ncbi:MAG: Rnf-Nqr domain containing protein, partial [Candidatus Enterosoma sp.]|nr:Rnf-Nqr domain containing protein [Candidatus Enterosoma sp.]
MENKKGFLRSFVDGLFFNNPVLSLFLGLTLAVIATARVQVALAIGAIVVLVLLITNLILSLLRKDLSKVTAAVVAAIISAGLSTIAMILVGKFFGFLTQAESAKYSIALLP